LLSLINYFIINLQSYEYSEKKKPIPPSGIFLI